MPNGKWQMANAQAQPEVGACQCRVQACAPLYRANRAFRDVRMLPNYTHAQKDAWRKGADEEEEEEEEEEEKETTNRKCKKRQHTGGARNLEKKETLPRTKKCQR